MAARVMWQLHLRDKLPHDVAPFVVAVVVVFFFASSHASDLLDKVARCKGEGACNAVCGHFLDKHLWQQAETMPC